MKVLVLHNAYQHYGGEDAVVRMESGLLESHGNLAGLHMVSNDQIVGLWGRVIAALGVVFSPWGYLRVRRVIQVRRPDVVHVHNFFPLLSPAVFYACRHEGVPVVLTLHNYRIVCPTALLMHNGAINERSLREGPWWALSRRVYRGSLAGTFLLCLMIWLHKRIGTWRKYVTRYVVLSEFGRGRFLAAGMPASRIVVKPNFVDIPAQSEVSRSGFLFVGRLSPEKGIGLVQEAAGKLRRSGPWGDCEIRVVGDGPLASVVAESGLHAMGHLSPAEVREQMHAATALLMPSLSYEGFPLTLAEAYACGLPVIASRTGALAELVEDGVTGLLFDPSSTDDLVEKMNWAKAHPDEMRRMGRAARQRYEERYTPDRNYKQLIAIYRDAIASFRSEASMHEA